MNQAGKIQSLEAETRRSSTHLLQKPEKYTMSSPTLHSKARPRRGWSRASRLQARQHLGGPAVGTQDTQGDCLLGARAGLSLWNVGQGLDAGSAS